MLLKKRNKCFWAWRMSNPQCPHQVISVERLELINLDRCLILMQVGERAFSTVMVSITVRVSRRAIASSSLILAARNLLKARNRLTSANLSVLQSIHKCVLSLGSMVLQFLTALLAEWSNLVEIKSRGHVSFLEQDPQPSWLETNARTK